LAAAWWALGSPAWASPDASLFRDVVAPILQRRCVGCHHDDQPAGEFSLETAAAAFSAGHIRPYDAGGSYLVDRITPVDGLAEMPLDADPLHADEIAAIRQWIDAGAVWPADVALERHSLTDFNWWSYRPVVRPRVPPLDDPWVRTPIDSFVLEQLRARHLTHANEADRRTLIRRVTYDLTGLPPTPEEVDAYLRDTDPQAYEKLVDRLLASDRYGERWARHWLDVVKYADTCGYDKDKLRPNAWPYRDYVIRSFNQDKPYSRFVQEQIAGDALFPGDPDGILGLGFLAAGPWDFIGHAEVSEEKIDGQVARNLDRDDMVGSVINTFCSVTVQCARCHDHKFDPITQENYYGLQAIFAAVDRADRAYGDSQVVYAAAIDFPAVGSFKPTGGKLRPIHVLHRGDVQSPGEPALPGFLPLQDKASWQLDPQLGESERRAALARWLTHADHPLVWRSIVNRVWQYHFGQGIVATCNDFGRMGGLPTHPALLDWLACEFRDNGQSFKALHRLIVTSSVYRQASQHSEANAAIDRSNLFLWRMNRRRLDAEEIRDSILAVSGTLDLKMGGPGYYLFALEKTEHSPHFEYHKFDPADPATHRRSIYRFVVRSQPNPWMTTLDCADSSQSTPRRIETLTALQALTLLNSSFNLEMAQRLAQRLESSAGSLADQVHQAMRLVTQRSPEESERKELVAYAANHGLPNLCRFLLNFSEFVYLD
jgi:hypothetical protein